MKEFCSNCISRLLGLSLKSSNLFKRFSAFRWNRCYEEKKSNFFLNKKCRRRFKAEKFARNVFVCQSIKTANQENLAKKFAALPVLMNLFRSPCDLRSCLDTLVMVSLVLGLYRSKGIITILARANWLWHFNAFKPSLTISWTLHHLIRA